MAGALALLPGCQMLLFGVAMPFVYDEVPLPASQVIRDIGYREGPDADPSKHRLDLLLPRASAEPWPVVVFVHGGGWTSGDKDLRVGGADVYRNIGRYLASRGVGTAVVSYRLQPEVGWQEQVEDVARAVAWVRAHVAHYGGDPEALFVMGHSAGGQLAVHVALDRWLAQELGAGPVCGMIPVSGAGYDLSDDRTYELGASRDYYEQRFRNGDAGDDWQREASPITRLREGAPPALILYAENDWAALHRQAELLNAALRDVGASSRLLEIPHEDHYSIVLSLTRPDEPAAPAILDFIRNTSC
jgi:acetyl esterase/lipase